MPCGFPKLSNQCLTEHACNSNTNGNSNFYTKLSTNSIMFMISISARTSATIHSVHAPNPNMHFYALEHPLLCMMYKNNFCYLSCHNSETFPLKQSFRVVLLLWHIVKILLLTFWNDRKYKKMKSLDLIAVCKRAFITCIPLASTFSFR